MSSERVTLRRVTSENYLQVLRLKVKPEQSGYVATNAGSIAQAKFHDGAWYRAIYANETPVGFVMLSIKPDEPEYFLWRFMIGAEHQRKGYGRRALQLVVEHVVATTDAKEFLLSYKDGELSPVGFYEACGFTATGEIDDGEHVMRMDLRAKSADDRLVQPAFPRSAKYHPNWMLENPFGGNAVWLTEWLTCDLKIESGMRVLDLGCGRAKSSIFLAKEFDLQVWATDLWISATENRQRIEAAQESQRVFPIHADARSLPFAAEFFDAILCTDAYPYFGTDDLYLNYLAQFLKPGGPIGIAGAGLMQELDGHVPTHLEPLWEQDFHALHTVAWWKNHWAKTGILDIDLAETMQDGIGIWRTWNDAIATEQGNKSGWFADVLDRDAGRYLGYFRLRGRRKANVSLAEYCWPDQLKSWPIKHDEWPVFRTS